MGGKCGGIRLGAYYPVQSSVHGMDPRAKLLGMLVFLTGIFWVDEFWVFGLVYAFGFGALWLAKNDGKQVSTDPVTGERLDSPKTLNAAAEFQEVCARLKSEKRVKSAREMLDERVKAKMAIQAGFAAGEETVANEAREVEAAAAARRKELKQKKRRDFAAKTPKAED